MTHSRLKNAFRLLRRTLLSVLIIAIPASIATLLRYSGVSLGAFPTIFLYAPFVYMVNLVFHPEKLERFRQNDKESDQTNSDDRAPQTEEAPCEIPESSSQKQNDDRGMNQPPPERQRKPLTACVGILLTLTTTLSGVLGFLLYQSNTENKRLAEDISYLQDLLIDKDRELASLSSRLWFKTNRKSSESFQDYTDSPQELLPGNGYEFYSKAANEVRVAPLTIDTTGSGYYYVKLESYKTGKPELIFFVHGGESVETLVPLGTYVLKYANGDNWYGESNLFGEDTVYSKAAEPFEFYDDGDYHKGWTVELYMQANGNLDVDTISEDEF